MQGKRTGPGEPDRWAITWVGEHANYPEFQLIWTTMASLTVVQFEALAEQWADTADRRLARGLALRALAPLRGNLAAVTIRFLDIFTLPLPPAEVHDDEARMLAWLPTLATELPTARPAAALHDAMLASLAFPTISGDDDQGLRQPWARVCLPCPFQPAGMFGGASPAVAALLAGLHELPRASLRGMAAERRRVPDTVWQQAVDGLAEAAARTGFPWRPPVLFWVCVGQVEEAIGETPTDPLIVAAVHGAASVRLLAGLLDEQTAAVLAGPYQRALNDASLRPNAQRVVVGEPSSDRTLACNRFFSGSAMGTAFRACLVFIGKRSRDLADAIDDSSRAVGRRGRAVPTARSGPRQAAARSGGG